MRTFVQRAAVVVVAGAAAFGLGSAAFGQTVTDPTGSVSVGVPAGGGTSNASGSVLAVSVGGCARSGLVAVAVTNTQWPPSCPWGVPGSAQGPIALGDGETRGTISISTEQDAYGMCWNPLATGCLPSVVVASDAFNDAHGGTISYGGTSCSASDWGLVPGIAVCGGSPATDESAEGSIAVMTGDGTADGRLLAYSDGTPSPFREGTATSDNVAVSQWDKAYGGRVAVSLHNSAHSKGGVAIAGTTHSASGWPQPANAYNESGGVSVAGGEAHGGAVAVAVGDATTSEGGLVAVSATGTASGADHNIDTE
jgi:hypothetical protein